MRNYCDLVLWLILLWRISNLHAQSTSYYKRTYYNVAPTSRHLHSGHRSTTLFHPSDLVPQESKRKDKPSKPYSKKISYRPSYLSDEDEFSREQYLASGEYSNESPSYNSNSNENDSREVAIGTQIRVQHPITVPKKSSYTTSYKKAAKRPVASELRVEPTKKRAPKTLTYYDADPFHVVAPPKSTLPLQSLSTGGGYNVYEEDQDIYTAPVRSKNTAFDRFKGVASKKQIEKYLEDQEKYLDEAFKSQLLHNSKYYKYLDVDDSDRENERESEPELYNTEYTPNPPTGYRGHYNNNNYNKNNYSFKSNRPRRRPSGSELKRSPKRLPNRKYRSGIAINV